MENQNKNILEIMGQFIKRSVTLKVLSIFILMLLLMIPMAYVKSLIEERESLRQSTVKEVSDKWANAQTVYGPILTIPLKKRILENGKIKELQDEAHILPSSLVIDGKISPQSLHRGIYEVAVYNSNISLSGKFEALSKYIEELNDYDIIWEDAYLTINISDLRGIKEKVIVKWNDQLKNVDPGSNLPELMSSGMTLRNVLDSAPGMDISNKFSFGLQLQGSHYLKFVPLGKETNVQLSSAWNDPSFSGSFLPDTRNVTEQGFKAEWKILELNRNYPQFWIGNRNAEAVKNSSFGVDLLLPATDYQKAMRSAKYALLAISLTFLTFFLVEIFNQKKMHPFQYILIGLSLCLFYALLLSISEHTNFTLAYLVSSIAIISMIGFYSKAILKNLKKTIVLIAVLCLTYSFVYITLQIQDYALLIGSIGLTLILAFTMYITRNINWYQLNSPKSEVHVAE
ncbi:MAG: cell envelope integrity protein CreD [Ignavibacteriales bacterium]